MARRILHKFLECIRDERGQALTEYVVLMAVVSTICFYLYYPENGFYAAIRHRYDLMALMLRFPGP